MHYTKIIVIFAVTKLISFAMETTKTEDKKMKRYKVAIWVWLILTAAAYINAVIVIINVIRKLWE